MKVQPKYPNIMKTNTLVPELYCTDLQESLRFYVDILNFDILYQRKDENFACLQSNGAQLMLDQIGFTRDWLTASLERPFGRGVNLQIQCTNIDSLYDRVQQNNLPVFLQLETKTYTVNGQPETVKQFIVQDPDGYLLRFQQDT